MPPRGLIGLQTRTGPGTRITPRSTKDGGGGYPLGVSTTLRPATDQCARRSAPSNSLLTGTPARYPGYPYPAPVPSARRGALPPALCQGRAPCPPCAVLAPDLFQGASRGGVLWHPGRAVDGSDGRPLTPHREDAGGVLRTSLGRILRNTRRLTRGSGIRRVTRITNVRHSG